MTPDPNHGGSGFSAVTRTWFDATFPEPTEVQRRGWAVIRGGDHALLVAPTGSGKTLAAFLAGIDALADPDRDAPSGTRVLYVSPLKALVYDIERNLRAPLAGIRRTAERMGEPPPDIRVAVRTGDTPQRERQRQIREPGDILVTTPESLFLILGSRARETLRTVTTVIVDEVHALAPTKRGTHLALSLERLTEITEEDPQRIGLSATVRPLDVVARYLGGTRPVEIVNASMRPNLDLTVTVPVPDMTNVVTPDPDAPRTGAIGWRSELGGSARQGGPILAKPKEHQVHTPAQERGMWPAIYPRLLDEVRANQSTIIFTNSRGLCERLAQRLNELAEEELVRAHHGSVSHEKRFEIEEGLKDGRIRGIVATSSLELGIDMGAVDRVILVESPGSVARGLQRVGRAGHQVGEVSVGRIFPKFRGDLLECAVIASQMREGELEALRVPENALDVLAQQIVAMCCDRDRSVEEIESIARRTHSFRDLTRGALEAVLDMLSGRYPSSDFADLRPLLRWDRSRDVLSARRGAVLVSRMNPGTIPDRGAYAVHLGRDGPRVGELDEEMVYETRSGDTILLGATTWRVEEIDRDRVLVSPAPGEPGRLPFWRGDGPGRPIETGRAIGAFLRELGAVPSEEAAEWIGAHTPLDGFAAGNLAAYVAEQREHTGALPTDRTICIERFRDELGDWRICILTPFGVRVHAPWAMALERVFSTRSGFDVQVMYAEDGIVLRLADTDELPEIDALFPAPGEVEDLVTDQLAESALFAGLFRENAVRSLLLPRRRPTQRNPLWAQRLKSQQLLAGARRYPAFPVVLETYRQALRDVFDIGALVEVLRQVGSRDIRVHEVETATASPFARSLVFAYVAAYMYEQDTPLAERRAQALTLDRNLLGELLGQAELRELIDVEVLAELEAELQCSSQNRRARDADELHDLLRRLGDLTPEELRARSTDDPDPWLIQLEGERRATPVRIDDEVRWIAAEDAGLYRDALGTLPSPGLPATFLEATDRALAQIVRRFARHRGPFLSGELARRYGLRAAEVEPVLRELERESVLVRGEIRPGGSELDHCDAEVLRRLKRQTLARLRHQVAPVDARTLGLFLPRWHGIGSDAVGPDRLLEAIVQLEGMSLPWRELSEVILPQRVRGFTVPQLDMLSASGRVIWVGRGPQGARDGRVALYLRDHAAALIPLPGEGAPETSRSWEVPGAIAAGGTPETGRASEDAHTPDRPHAVILRFLRGRGASFTAEIEMAVRDVHASTTSSEFESALWDLVWDGWITNDTFGPLQGLGRTVRSSRRPRRSATPVASGRWSMVEQLVSAELGDTERTLARSRVLLERYGVVSREAAKAENMPGGFSPIYRVLKAMEDGGRVRRGYFVEGLSGAQFAQVGAVDRLRAVRPDETGDAEWTEDDVQVLGAVDPANPYGALLPWPVRDVPDPARPRRVGGAWVLLLDGHPVVYVGPGGRHLLTFSFPARSPEEILPVVLPALRRVPGRSGRRRLRIETIDCLPAHQWPHLELMRRCGFERSYRGLIDVQI